MTIREGTVPFGLWHVYVRWDGDLVYQVRFVRKPVPGPVPGEISRFLAGKETRLEPLRSVLLEEKGNYSDIYQAVSAIPYGTTCSYGEIANRVNTHARVVGMAMKRNTTPLCIPCHRVVSASGGPGGFTPDPQIKTDLLSLEKGVMLKEKKRTSAPSSSCRLDEP